jgi:hypothetical protein
MFSALKLALGEEIVLSEDYACLSEDLTPDMSGVVWLYSVSPFPNSLRRAGDF